MMNYKGVCNDLSEVVNPLTGDVWVVNQTNYVWRGDMWSELIPDSDYKPEPKFKYNSCPHCGAPINNFLHNCEYCGGMI